MRTVRHVVDNKVFLLGLDEIYRERIKTHERTELLKCARRVAKALNRTPVDVPIEGYYADDEKLTEYFLVMRCLQDIDATFTSQVESLREFKRLSDVTSSPLYGRSQDTGKLLPVGRDSLSQALIDSVPNWTIPGLTAAAYNLALNTDDISLVGLAARVKDAVVLAALRESVVLYAEMECLSALHPPPEEYVWEVDKELEEHAHRFITTFNALFGEALPEPGAGQAERYWHAYKRNHILGRCVRLGWDDTVSPVRYYHWAILTGSKDQYTVHEFWSSDVWTTKRLQSALHGAEKYPWL